MSPISSVATAFAPSSTAPSVALDPDSAVQSASVVSQHLLGTGGLLFTAVAFVSIAGYFLHGRREAKGTHTSNPWASFTSFISSMRHRGPATQTTAAATDWPVDLEAGPDVGHHVSMVYARFFHPTFWNLVECHPGTATAPAIYVEDETNEIPLSGLKLPGTSSFLNMDNDDSGGHEDSLKYTGEQPDQESTNGVEEFPPYDTSVRVHVNFTSSVIGATIRTGAFLSVPGEPEHDSSSSSYNTTQVSMKEEPSNGLSESPSFDSDFDFSGSPYDGIEMSPPRAPSSTRRQGLVDMAHLARGLKGVIPEEGYGLVATVSRRGGLFSIPEVVEMDPDIPDSDMEGQVDGEPTISNIDIDPHDGRDGLQGDSSDGDITVSHQDGPTIMRRLLAELRDPNLDCNPRSLSEDSDDEYVDSRAETAQSPRSEWHLENTGRDTPGSTSSTPRSDPDSSEGSIYPSTPPTILLASPRNVRKVGTTFHVAPWFDVAQAMPPMFPDSPPSLPTKAYVRARRDNHPMLHGPRLPLMALPCI